MHPHVQHTLTHLNAPSWTNEMSRKPCVHAGRQIPLLASHSDQNRFGQKMILMVWHKIDRITRSYSSFALTYWGRDKMADYFVKWIFLKDHNFHSVNTLILHITINFINKDDHFKYQGVVLLCEELALFVWGFTNQIMIHQIILLSSHSYLGYIP